WVSSTPPTTNHQPPTTNRQPALALPCRAERIAHQHRDRQRADAARYGRDRARDVGDLGMHVADENRAVLLEHRDATMSRRIQPFDGRPIRDAIDPDVDDDRAWLDEVLCHHRRAADGG